MQKFIYFPPHRKQFYFSEEIFSPKNEKTLLYTPYSKKSRIIFKLFLLIPPLRFLIKCHYNDLSLNVKTILDQIGCQNSLFQINLGTEGSDQKTTLVKQSEKQTSFFKIGNTKQAFKLIDNEYLILKKLDGAFNSPKVLSFLDSSGYKMLETEYLKGKKIQSFVIDKRIIEQLINISQFELKDNEGKISCFNHGDFCPWNILEDGSSNLILIDWEFGGNFPLGYDLFTFIFQTSFLLHPEKTNQEIIQQNKIWIKCFFDRFKVAQVDIYLKDFIELKIEQERIKNKESILCKKYEVLKNEIIDFQL